MDKINLSNQGANHIKSNNTGIDIIYQQVEWVWIWIEMTAVEKNIQEY
jgi:hypothetical protein